MADLTDEELILKIAKGTIARARFSSAENMIDNPTAPEYEIAILDAVEDINNSKPATDYDLATLYNKGSRWVRVLYLATEINIYRLLVKDWVANGMDANIEDLSLASKLPDYQSLLSDLEAKFNETILAMKAGGPVIRSSTFSTMPNNLGANGNNSAYLVALKNQLDKNNTVY